MSRAATLRWMATGLLSLAVDASNRGDTAYSEMLVQRANDYMDQADDIEAEGTPHRRSPSTPEVATQQQQQPQRKQDE
jgi:hypothetical protein